MPTISGDYQAVSLPTIMIQSFSAEIIIIINYNLPDVPTSCRSPLRELKILAVKKRKMSYYCNNDNNLSVENKHPLRYLLLDSHLLNI